MGERNTGLDDPEAIEQSTNHAIFVIGKEPHNADGSLNHNARHINLAQAAGAALLWHVSPKENKPNIYFMAGYISPKWAYGELQIGNELYSHFMGRLLQRFGVPAYAFFGEDRSVETWQELRLLIRRVRQDISDGHIDIVASHNAPRVEQILRDPSIQKKIPASRYSVLVQTPEAILEHVLKNQQDRFKIPNDLRLAIANNGRDYFSQIVYFIMRCIPLPSQIKNPLFMRLIARGRAQTPQTRRDLAVIKKWNEMRARRAQYF